MKQSETYKRLAPILAEHQAGDEILKMLQSWDKGTEFVSFEDGTEENVDMAAAVYWACSDWHGGQSCPLYAALCQTLYTPGPCANGPEPDSMEKLWYNELNQLLEMRS